MEGFEAQKNTPQCEFGYNPDESSCTIKLPTGATLELIETTLTEPNGRDSFLKGFCPSQNAMGEVHLIEELGKLSVKKVTVDGNILFEAPTMH
jgi:hypothetical protein